MHVCTQAVCHCYDFFFSPVPQKLLEEVVDNGFPLATESNVLKELIRPPSIVQSVVTQFTGESQYVLYV